MMCHSFAMEQIHLGRLEVTAARALARAGFPVLRFHGQGYGDSDDDMRAVGLSSHRSEAMDAVGLLSSETGVGSVGLIGARFGATVAALVAQDLALPYLVMWQPVVRGAQYMKEFLRSRVYMEMTQSGGEGGASEVAELIEELESVGVTDIKGFPLSRETYRDVSSVDLAKDIRVFGGACLLVSLSRGGGAASGVKRLSEHLRSMGADCTTDVVQHPYAHIFGQYHYMDVGGAWGKRDVHGDLADALAHRTLEWAGALVSPQKHRGERMADPGS